MSEFIFAKLYLRPEEITSIKPADGGGFYFVTAKFPDGTQVGALAVEREDLARLIEW